ncbi:hypothetical protein JOQ06_012542 [Pogonophryne albipinna]|uniref:Arf-GAP with coiled-coil, ANK repeat and PH domain-containing protein n=1 Tax=Pogonophryne albipinna TaxID=1090488 RepID=A0AAD6F4N8_9TELE|nr:hypothetical protein JOQ06_012542 [Pogonophryne albipinna]
MDSLLDFEECVKDSPEFRLKLELFEADVNVLETHLDKVMKLCGKMVEAGQVYNAANQLFLSGLAELSMFHQKDSVINILFDQTQRAISQQLTNLCTQFLPQLLDTRREFLRIGGDLDSAALKNSQVSRHRATDAERASHLLLATRKCYQHFALDYCLQLNTFKTQQRLDVLNSVFSFVHAQFTFFHQGFDLLRDLEPTMKTMAAQLSQLSLDCAAKRKELENTHLLVQQRDASGEPLVVPCSGSVELIQGYLFKRSRRKTKTWKRCWFSIRDNQLIYRKSHKEASVVLFEDLRLCAVKSLENIDRRFCFDLLSVQKSCALQADSEEVKQSWLEALQGSIDLAYRQPKEAPPPQGGGDSSPGPPPQRQSVLGEACRAPGNMLCCDCGEEEPRWASINLGVTVCIQCSGIHRIYEARCSDEGRVKPRSDSSRSEKEAWIKEKYVEKRFVQSSSEGAAAGKAEAGRRLYRAAMAGDLVAMAAAMAEGSEVNGSIGEEGGGKTPLIGAAIGFLLLNGAKVNHRDLRGQGALHAAATAGHTGQVCLLLKRGANQYAVDERGQDPLAIAVEIANADIVTL